MSGPDASLVIRCDCSDLGHLIVFDVWHWDTESPPHSELYAHLELETHRPWWKRLTSGARYALTGKTGKWWWVESVIKDASATALRDFLDDYLDRSWNAASETPNPQGQGEHGA